MSGPTDDLSSLVDEKPSDVHTVAETRTPLGSVVEGDDKGETLRPVLTPDRRRRVGVPTRVHDTLTSYQQLREAQCAKWPCAACGNGQFVHPESSLGLQCRGFLKETVHGKLHIMQSLGVADFVYCEDDPVRPALDDHGDPIFEADGTQKMTGGPGFKFLRYNCPAWRERTAEFLPHWMPSHVVKLVDRLSAVSRRLRARGVLGYLRRIRGEKP
ncbi:MAG: hypothetical protein JXB32_17950 [Deltaproteobacteria bacterium]|nr:hypothetical protein [Deltaproteobacteria bacterium]